MDEKTAAMQGAQGEQDARDGKSGKVDCDFRIDPLKQIWNSYLHYGDASRQVGLGELTRVTKQINSVFEKMAPEVFEKILENNCNKLEASEIKSLSEEFAKGVANKPKSEWSSCLKNVLNSHPDVLSLHPDLKDKCDKISQESFDKLKESFDDYNKQIQNIFQKNKWNDPNSWVNVSLDTAAHMFQGPQALFGFLVGLMFRFTKRAALSESEQKAYLSAMEKIKNWKPAKDSSITLDGPAIPLSSNLGKRKRSADQSQVNHGLSGERFSSPVTNKPPLSGRDSSKSSESSELNL